MTSKSLIASLLIGASFATAGGVYAQTAPQQKAIRVAGDATPVAEKLELTVRATKGRYAVNEPIKLKVKVNADAYLYISTRNKDGESVLLSPAANGALIRVKAGNQTIDPKLIGDAAGTEELTVIASSADLGLAGLTAKTFDKQLQSKGIRIAGEVPRNKPPTGVSVSDPVKVKVKIANDDEAGNADGIALVSTDKRRYAVGDDVRIAYGVSKPGWVHLFVVYPDGNIDDVLKEKFDQAGVKTVTAEITEPAGRQSLVAVWTANGDLSAESMSAAGFGKSTETTAAKGIKLREQKPEAKPSVTATDVDVTAQ